MTSTSIALPAPLLQWLDAEAASRDLSRSALVSHILLRAMEAKDENRLSAIEAKLIMLEKLLGSLNASAQLRSIGV